MKGVWMAVDSDTKMQDTRRLIVWLMSLCCWQLSWHCFSTSENALPAAQPTMGKHW